MTNKVLFSFLGKEQQLRVAGVLTCYNECHVEYYLGEFHVCTSYSLLGKYPNDFKCYENKFTQKEFYNDDPDWYLRAWDELVRTSKDLPNDRIRFNEWVESKKVEAVIKYLSA